MAENQAAMLGFELPFDISFKATMAKDEYSFKVHFNLHATDRCRARQFLLGIS